MLNKSVTKTIHKGRSKHGAREQWRPPPDGFCPYHGPSLAMRQLFLRITIMPVSLIYGRNIASYTSPVNNIVSDNIAVHTVEYHKKSETERCYNTCYHYSTCLLILKLNKFIHALFMS